MLKNPVWSPATLALGSLALLSQGCATSGQNAATTPTPSTKPNIVFVLADDLGYGDLGCYGQKIIRTPNIDRLAAQGMRFTNFYCGSPVCAPSRNVLMTGQHTGHTLIRGNLKIDLRPEDVTVGKVLQGAGYTTGMIGKWSLGAEHTTGAPSQQGFDYFFGYEDQTHAHNYYPTYLVRNEERVPLKNVVPNEGRYGQGVASVKAEYSDDLMVDDALKFFEQNKNKPFCLFYTATLPHANDEATGNGSEIPSYGVYAKENWPDPEKGYAAMVTRLDDDVGRMLAKLEELGIANNTIIVFTSDNGPHDEGGHDSTYFNSGGPLRGIKRDVYEGGIRVPFIARWPGHIPADTVSNHVAYFGDWLATSADIAGVKPPPDLDSLSFLPELLGESQKQVKHDYIYWEFYEKSAQAVRLGDWKAVRMPMLTGPIQLYDLRTDIGEQHDVAAEHPDIVARMEAIMQKEHTPSPYFHAPGEGR